MSHLMRPALILAAITVATSPVAAQDSVRVGDTVRVSLAGSAVQHVGRVTAIAADTLRLEPIADLTTSELPPGVTLSASERIDVARGAAVDRQLMLRYVLVAAAVGFVAGSQIRRPACEDCDYPDYRGLGAIVGGGAGKLLSMRLKKTPQWVTVQRTLIASAAVSPEPEPLMRLAGIPEITADTLSGIADREWLRVYTSDGLGLEGRLGRVDPQSRAFFLRNERNDSIPFANVDILWTAEGQAGTYAIVGAVVAQGPAVVLHSLHCAVFTPLFGGCGSYFTTGVVAAFLGGVSGAVIGNRIRNWKVRYSRRP